MTEPSPASVARVKATEQGDPGRADAAWWLGLPVATAAILFAIALWDYDFYLKWVLPEATGALEILHILVPLAGLVIALGVMRIPAVRDWKLLWWTVGFFALTCFYIAGEESSWGQWYFHWQTPEYWSKINQQNETNLHNSSYFFNDLPRHALKIAMLVGGVILPLLAMQMRGPFATVAYLRLLTPPRAIVPVALVGVLFNILSSVAKMNDMNFFIPRPSEAHELFMYMFIVFYLVMLRRRARAL